MHGEGELILDNGDKIKTTWVNGKKHGTGVLYP
jgi:hypothetical protein